jgi:acyl carrier protein
MLGDGPMTRAEVEAAVFGALTGIAPEVDPPSLRRDVPLRDQVDLDSFDYLNFMIALHQATGVEVPEADYPKLTTVNSAVDYLAQRVAA